MLKARFLCRLQESLSSSCCFAAHMQNHGFLLEPHGMFWQALECCPDLFCLHRIMADKQPFHLIFLSAARDAHHKNPSRAAACSIIIWLFIQVIKDWLDMFINTSFFT